MMNEDVEKKGIEGKHLSNLVNSLESDNILDGGKIQEVNLKESRDLNSKSVDWIKVSIYSLISLCFVLGALLVWLLFQQLQQPKNLGNVDGRMLNSGSSTKVTTFPTKKENLVTQKTPTPENLSTKNEMGQNSIIKVNKNENGPWNGNLYVSSSTDGQSFSERKLLVNKAGVPSLAKDLSGKIYLAFQWFPDDNDMAFDKVAIITSSDGGNTWSSPVQAVFDEYPESFMRPFDPTIVLTPEGKIRMYFTGNTGDKSGNMSQTVYFSAISDDGIHYKYEKGERFAINNTQLLDSAVMYFQNMYYIIAPKSPSSGAYFATSSDGLSLKRQDDVVSEDGYLWTGNLAVVGDKLRFYGGGKQGRVFYSEYSQDGVWGSPKQTNFQGGDPTVLSISENKYLIVVVGK